MNLLLSAKGSGDKISLIIIFVLMAFGLVVLLTWAIDGINRKRLHKKVLNSPNSITRSAYFVRSKYLGGHSSANNSGVVSAKSLFNVYVSYRDDNGNEVVAKAVQRFTTKEMNHFRAKRYLTIKTLGKHVIILDDATNPITPDMFDTVKNAQMHHDPRLAERTKESDLPPFVGTITYKGFVIFSIILALIGAGGIVAMVILAFVNIDEAFTYILGIVPFVMLLLVALLVTKGAWMDINALKNGTPGKAKLVRLDSYLSGGKHRNTVMNAFVLFEGETRRIRVQSAELYVYLQDYFLNKDIPVCTFKKHIVIDYRKLYTNADL